MAEVKPIRILILGYPYFGNKLRELAAGYGSGELPCVFKPSGKSKPGKLLSLFFSDVIYLIGGDLRHNRFYRMALMLNKKLIFHWVGSDILEMKAWLARGRQFSLPLVNRVFHWAEADWTAEELKEMGIESKIVPLTPAAFPEAVKPFPEKFAVLTYLPAGREDFYGESTIVALARKFPEIVFLAAAMQTAVRNREWPENLVPLGWVDDMAGLYGEVTLLIRLTRHDGVSFMVLEALANGRHVIWGHPFTGVIHTDGNLDGLCSLIGDLYQKHCRGDLTVNRAGRNFVRRFYHPQVIWERISREIYEVVNQ